MRRLIVLTLIAGLAAAFGLAWSDSEVAPPATENVGPLQVSELNWDFGYFPKNATVTHQFKLKNTGAKPLKILRVKPSCGCTSAPLAKTDLAPGEATDLEVTFNARNYQGKVTKSVTVLTDDSTQSVINLQFSGDVGGIAPTLILEPDYVSFDSMATGKKATRRLKITNNDIQDVSITLVEFPQKVLDAKLKKAQLGIGDASELTLILTGKDLPEGFFSKTLTMEVKGHVDYRVSLPVTGTLVANGKH